jgi:hypothetical protein
MWFRPMAACALTAGLMASSAQALPVASSLNVLRAGGSQGNLLEKAEYPYWRWHYRDRYIRYRHYHDYDRYRDYRDHDWHRYDRPYFYHHRYWHRGW